MKVERTTSPFLDGNFGMELDSDMNVVRLRHAAQKVRAEFLGELDGHLEDLLNNFVGELEKQGEKESAANGGGTVQFNVDGTKKLLKEKVFIARESLLTQLLANKNIKTIYNIFIAMLIVFILNTAVYEYIENGHIKLDFNILLWQFSEFPRVLSTWCVMMMWVMVINFVGFQFWADNRHKDFRIPDSLWVCLYILSQLFMGIFPVWAVVAYQLPPASTIIIIAEQLRLIMKTHSFVRENTPKVLNWKRSSGRQVHSNNGNNPRYSTSPRVGAVSRCNGHTRSKSDGCTHNASHSQHPPSRVRSDSSVDFISPDFSQYLYFLFAPTLIYRSQYPRTPKVRWNVVNTNLLQVIACLFYTYYTIERFCIPIFHNFSQESLTLQRLILCVFSCMLPGTLVLILAFFAILHSWMNAFAEMLRFADRQFYKDWWNCRTYANYYRTWNIIVHDWLYTYIYMDFQVLRINKNLSMVAVFIISAFVHEYVLSMAFGFFFPVLMFLFGGVGFLFIFITERGASNIYNIFVWLSLFMGNGVLMCLYSQEWYARQNCHIVTDNFTLWESVMYVVTPKSLFVHQ